MDIKDNNGFEDMAAFARERLSGRDFTVIAKNCGALLDETGENLIIQSLGKEIKLPLPSLERPQDMDIWQYMVLLHYLDLGDGIFTADQWMAFGDMKDGLVRGTKFDQSSSLELNAIFKGLDETQIRKMLLDIGASFVQTKADLGAAIPFLPKFPLFLNIWLEDDEFPVSAKMLVPKSADHYLTIEDAVTAGGMLIQVLGEQIYNVSETRTE